MDENEENKKKCKIEAEKQSCRKALTMEADEVNRSTGDTPFGRNISRTCARRYAICFIR